MRELAILGADLANELLSKGFELVWIKEGKLTNVFYFVDTVELEKYLTKKNF